MEGLGFIFFPLFLITVGVLGFGIATLGAWKARLFRAYQAWRKNEIVEIRPVGGFEIMNPFSLFNALLPLPGGTQEPEFYESIPDWALDGYKEAKKVCYYGLAGLFGTILLLLTLEALDLI